MLRVFTAFIAPQIPKVRLLACMFCPAFPCWSMCLRRPRVSSLLHTVSSAAEVPGAMPRIAPPSWPGMGRARAGSSGKAPPTRGPVLSSVKLADLRAVFLLPQPDWTASACQPWPLRALGCCSSSVIITLVMVSVLSCRQTLCLLGRRLAVGGGGWGK